MLGSPPLKMNLKVSGSARYSRTDQVEGLYILKKGLENGKNYWFHQGGYLAVWWEDDGDDWYVGLVSEIGQNRGYIYASNSVSWPTNHRKVWKYVKDDTFMEVTKADDVVFEDWSGIPGDTWFVDFLVFLILSVNYVFISVQPPPLELEIVLKGKAYEKQSGREGKYLLADRDVNGYPYWVQEDGSKNAIWLDKVDVNWKIASSSSLGSTNYGIKGQSGKDSYPNMITDNWIYYDGDNDETYNATSSEIIIRGIFYVEHFGLRKEYMNTLPEILQF